MTHLASCPRRQLLETHWHRAALAIYCAAYALWAEAQEMSKKHGTTLRSPEGFPMQSPENGLANRQAEIMLRIGSEIGSTRASRARMVSPQANPLLPLFDSKGEDLTMIHIIPAHC
jgi:P27 family predicted phage terminase small subunit